MAFNGPPYNPGGGVPPRGPTKLTMPGAPLQAAAAYPAAPAAPGAFLSQPAPGMPAPQFQYNPPQPHPMLLRPPMLHQPPPPPQQTHGPSGPASQPSPSSAAQPTANLAGGSGYPPSGAGATPVALAGSPAKHATAAASQPSQSGQPSQAAAPEPLRKATACGVCGTVGGDLSWTECGHVAVCGACGKRMAEGGEACGQCGQTVTRLVKEFLVRTRPTSRDLSIAKFPGGLPGFRRGDQRGWALRRQQQGAGGAGGGGGRGGSEAAKARQRSLPWVLEDEAGQVSYVGQLESGWQHSAFFVLIMTGGEFVAVPAGAWYSFQKRGQQRSTLTLEEAERIMAQKNRSVEGRREWLGPRGKGGGGGEEEGGKGGEKGRRKVKEEAEEIDPFSLDDEREEDEEGRGRRKRGKGGRGDDGDDGERGDDWEHEEDYSDDDEAQLVDRDERPEDEEEGQDAGRAQGKGGEGDEDEEEERPPEEEEEGGLWGLSDSGRALQQLLEKERGGKEGEEEGEEEELEGDEEEDEEEALQSPIFGQQLLGLKEGGQQQQQQQAEGRGVKRKEMEAPSAKKDVPSGKRTPPLAPKREGAAAAGAAAAAGGAALGPGRKAGGEEGKAAAPAAPAESKKGTMELSEEAVRACLTQAPMTSAELVKKFRAFLKTDEDKVRFREITKKVGKMQEIDGIKYIALK